MDREDRRERFRAAAGAERNACRAWAGNALQPCRRPVFGRDEWRRPRLCAADLRWSESDPPGDTDQEARGGSARRRVTPAARWLRSFSTCPAIAARVRRGERRAARTCRLCVELE